MRIRGQHRKDTVWTVEETRTYALRRELLFTVSAVADTSACLLPPTG